MAGAYDNLDGEIEDVYDWHWRQREEARAKSSRESFKKLLKDYYVRCAYCTVEDESELFLLPCMHRMCTYCIFRQLNKPKLKKSIYKNNMNRMECRKCHFPMYLRMLDEKFETPHGMIKMMPLQSDKLAMGHAPEQDLEDVPIMAQPRSGKAAKPARYLGSYETRMGDYYLHHTIGEYGNDVQNGKTRRVTGFVVDESPQPPEQPLIILVESWFDHFVVYKLNGELVNSRRVYFKIWNATVGDPPGSLVSTVCEKNYVLGRWTPPLFPDRWEMGHDELVKDGEWSQKFRPSVCEIFGVTAEKTPGRFIVSFLGPNMLACVDLNNDPHFYPFKNLHLEGPYYLAKLSNNDTLVSCMFEHKIKIVRENEDKRIAPEIVREWGGLGSDLVGLCYPRGVCVDAQDRVYVADTGNFRVMMYNRDGMYLQCPVRETWTIADNVKPTSVQVMKDGSLLVMMEGQFYSSVHVYKEREPEPCCCDCGPDTRWGNCWDFVIGTYREPDYTPIN